MHTSRRTAFTLVELMIAIGLGVVIIYTATSGLRLASTSVTLANRLSLENSMMRAGFTRALDEVDFWLAYDDPDDADAQQLRAVSTYPYEGGGRKAGLPFTPFQTSNAGDTTFSSIGIHAPMPAATAPPTPGSESDRFWDHRYSWPVSDPRTWWRGNMAEHSNTDLRMGDYSLFAEASPASGHPWLYNQMDQLKTALGYVGMCDYLPSNTIYAYASASSAQSRNPGKMLNEFIFLGGIPNFRNSDGAASLPQGLYRCTKDTTFAIAPRNPIGGTVDHFAFCRSFAKTGVFATADNVGNLLGAIRSSESLPTVRPGHWPGLSVSVARYLTHNRFACTCWVRMATASTGQIIEFSFNGFGTTLRGARQQRRNSPQGTAAGWARWYAAGDPRNDPTLDSP